jgi:hypothetical protein
MQRIFRISAILFAVVCMAPGGFAGKGNAKQLVDSGSFGIFVNGHRVATETFKVEQSSTMSVTRSEIRVEDLPQKIAQSSEMQLDPNGDLRRYDWQQYQPQKAELVVEPKDEFLVERLIPGPASKDKPQNLPHLLPHSTVILDDNFFSHRQILAWKYLAAGCHMEGDVTKCKLTPAQYGILIPNQHASSTVFMEYKGLQKVTVKGTEKQLGAFLLRTESGDWTLYLDESHRLVRILVPDEKTEIVRD